MLDEDFTDIEAIIDEREKFANRYFNLERKLRQRIIEISRQVTTAIPTAVATSTRTTPKLPEIVIQKFDGDIRKQPTWRNKWKPMIGDRPDIDDVTKFAYLESSITDGRAASILASVTETYTRRDQFE